MANVKHIRALGNQLVVTMDDGSVIYTYPTGGDMWIATYVAPVEPDPDPEPTGTLTDYFSPAFTMTGDWEAHASYSRGGTDWGMVVGTDIRAVADGTVVNYPNIDGAGLKTMLVFDTPKVRKIAASTTLMNGTYRENGTANGISFMMQHLSGQVPDGHYNMGDTVAISGNTGTTTGPHLHAQILAGTSVGSDRMDFMKFV